MKHDSINIQRVFCACYVVCNNSVKIKPVLATRHKPAVRAAAAIKYQVIPFTWQMFALSRSVNESEKNNPGFTSEIDSTLKFNHF